LALSLTVSEFSIKSAHFSYTCLFSLKFKKRSLCTASPKFRTQRVSTKGKRLSRVKSFP